MKNKIIKLLASISIFSMALTFTGCSNSLLGKEDSKNSSDVSVDSQVNTSADLSFAVMGDIHNNTGNFKNTVDEFYKINPNMNALVLNGDIVDEGKDEQYKSMKKAIEKNSSKIPDILIKTIGNHEFYNYDESSNSQDDIDNFTNKYLEFAGYDKVYNDMWINGYHFISLGSDNLEGQDLNSTQASLSDTQLSWLKDKLKEDYVVGKPIFVFLHQPIETDFFGRQWYGVRQGDELKAILSNYPEVVIFSSHTHKEFGEDSIIENMPYTMVYTGAVGYTLVKDENSENGRSRNNNINNSIYVEVEGNTVIIKERDIKNHKWVLSKKLGEDM